MGLLNDNIQLTLENKCDMHLFINPDDALVVGKRLHRFILTGYHGLLFKKKKANSQSIYLSKTRWLLKSCLDWRNNKYCLHQKQNTKTFMVHLFYARCYAEWFRSTALCSLRGLPMNKSHSYLSLHCGVWVPQEWTFCDSSTFQSQDMGYGPFDTQSNDFFTLGCNVVLRYQVTDENERGCIT